MFGKLLLLLLLILVIFVANFPLYTVYCKTSKIDRKYESWKIELFILDICLRLLLPVLILIFWEIFMDFNITCYF